MEPIGEISEPSSLDPVSLGFMCGIEIHQQLETNKLHSRLPSKLYDYKLEDIPEDWPRFTRKIRASEGESGKIDIAAQFEQRRNRSFVYLQSPNSGLIEMDEAPPDFHDHNAVDIVLTISSMMKAKPFPILQVMRKTVADGSNTSGFQRTTLISTNGKISTVSGTIGIDLISVEEDSARKLGNIKSEKGETVIYTLDRLGIPLVEIATAPDIKSPEHAKETARLIGSLLRDTRRVRRGLGTIRQDLNVSIACGDRVEIKGCQDLDWIPKIIYLEMARQLHFYRLANELRRENNLPPLPPNREDDAIPVENRVALTTTKKILGIKYDITDIFQSTNSSLIQSLLDNDSKVLAVILPGFANKLGKKILDNNESQFPRLGRELASAAKSAGVEGIFHSDELPSYGISEEEIKNIRERLSMKPIDAFVLSVAPSWQAELALESVIIRARKAFHRIPQEVRNVVIRKGQPEDGTTTALRPLPGGARMYPETDIPPLHLKETRWERICRNIPLTNNQRKERLQKLKISENQIEAILNSELDDILFEGIDGELNLHPKAWASALLEFKTKKFQPLSVAIYLREKGKITKDAILELVEDSISGDLNSIKSWMISESESRGLSPMDESEIEKVVIEVIMEKSDFIEERGMSSIGPLMGIVLQKLGSSADGKIVNQILRSEISKIL